MSKKIINNFCSAILTQTDPTVNEKVEITSSGESLQLLEKKLPDHQTASLPYKCKAIDSQLSDPPIVSLLCRCKVMDIEEISSLNALTEEHRLTDCLEWLKTHCGLTGESALLILSWIGGGR